MLQPARKPILWMATSALLVLLAPALAPVEAGEPDATTAQDDGAGDPGRDGIRAVGQCRPNRVKFRTETNFVQMDDTNFANIPGTGFPFTHGGSGNACVIVVVTLQSSAGGPAPETQNSQLRARIPGFGVAEASDPWLGRQAEGDFFRTNTVQFVFPSVPPGQHAIRIQLRVTQGDPNRVTVGPRSVTVHHTAG